MIDGQATGFELSLMESEGQLNDVDGDCKLLTIIFRLYAGFATATGQANKTPMWPAVPERDGLLATI